MSTITCKFCGKKTETQLHSYCGFFNVYNFGGKDEDRAAIEAHKKSPEYRASQMYHDVTIEGIQKISISAGIFKYNESKLNMERMGDKPLFDSNLNGRKCSESVVQSNKWIAHFDGNADVVIDYKFEGKTKSKTITIAPKPGEGIWYLTLHINEELRLELGLRTMSVTGKQTIKDTLLATVDLDLSA